MKRNCKSFISFIVTLIFVNTVTMSVFATNGQNNIKNGDFQNGDTGWTLSGTSAGTAITTDTEGAPVVQVPGAADGNKVAKIISNGKNIQTAYNLPVDKNEVYKLRAIRNVKGGSFIKASGTDSVQANFGDTSGAWQETVFWHNEATDITERPFTFQLNSSIEGAYALWDNISYCKVDKLDPVFNQSFEYDFDNWGSVAPASVFSIEQSPENVHMGSKSLKVSGNGTTVSLVQPLVVDSAVSTYKLEYWIKGQTTTDTIKFVIQDGNNTPKTTHTVFNQFQNWTRYEATFNTSGNISTMTSTRPSIKLNIQSGGSDIIYLDGIRLTALQNLYPIDSLALFNNQDGELLNLDDEATTQANIKLYLSNYGEEAKVQSVIALYAADGTLKDVSCTSLDTLQKRDVFDYEKTFNFESGTSKGNKIKIFIWDGIENIHPVSTPIHFYK